MPLLQGGCLGHWAANAHFHGNCKSGMTRTGTLSASERDRQAFPRTRRITVRASGEASHWLPVNQ